MTGSRWCVLSLGSTTPSSQGQAPAAIHKLRASDLMAPTAFSPISSFLFSACAQLQG